RILNQAANAAVKYKGSLFQILYRRYVPRLGHNQTIGVIAHRLCRLIWKILHQGVRYEERGPAISQKSQRYRAARMIKELQSLGYRVEPANAQSAVPASYRPHFRPCDALSRNLPKPLTVILGNCLAHARRHVVNVTPSFPAECRHILERVRQVYRYDAEARAHHLSPIDRLALHQAHSGPVMKALHAWLAAQLDEHRIEPNSGLGKAITYFLNHWTPLTLLLRQPGAPLDNNIVERSLKRAILHRTNASFDRTSNG